MNANPSTVPAATTVVTATLSYKTEIHRLYQLLSQFKLYNNPDKVYLRKLRLKRQMPGSSELIFTYSGGNGSNGAGMGGGGNGSCAPVRKKMKLNEDVENPDSSSIASKDGPSPSPSPYDDEPPPSNIIILKTGEYEKVKMTKYTLTDLRTLCAHYGIKKSGTKPELTLRIYNHLRQSHVIVKIQRKFRQYVSAKYRLLSGPGYLHVKNCVNDTDFYTFDKLTDIALHNLFTFRDRDGKIYGFHIASIYNLILNSFPEITNPYNRNLLPVKIVQNVYDKLIYGTLLRFRATIKLEDVDNQDNDDEENHSGLSREKQEDLYIVGLFQHINTLGNYSDSEWFTTLQRPEFLRFIRHIHDIWYYRANLSQDMKERICPPHGNPFMLNNISVNLNVVNLLNDSELRTIAVSIINNIVKRGVTREDQCLGAFYVLATLTIVNQNARNALPWLYEAVL
jgi:SAP domain